MPEFTVLACDLITGVTLDELPVKPSTITWDLNGPGSISDLTIPASALRGRDPNDVQVALSEGRTAIYIDMDGALIWGGPLWRKVYSSVTRAYTLTVGGWWSYWQRQLITTALQFRGADQFDIVRTLLSLRNGEPGFVPIIMSAADSGVVRNYSWEVGDLKGVGEAIEQMSDNIGGFEFVVDVRRNVDTGRPERVLRIGSPRIGAAGTASSVVLEYTEDPATGERSGNVDSYEWLSDGTTLATETWGAAETNAGAAIVESAAAPELTANGYPILPGVLQGHETVVERDTLVGYVQAQQASSVAPQQTPTFVVENAADLLIGNWFPGDDALIQITDPRWPSPDGVQPGLRQWTRTLSASLDIATNKISITATPALPTTTTMPRTIKRPLQSEIVRGLGARLSRLERSRIGVTQSPVPVAAASWPALTTTAFVPLGQVLLYRQSSTVQGLVVVDAPAGVTVAVRIHLLAAPAPLGNGAAGVDAYSTEVIAPAGTTTVQVGMDAPDLWSTGWGVAAIAEARLATGTGSGTAHAVLARIDQR